MDSSYKEGRNVDLGSFENRTGIMIVADPGYPLEDEIGIFLNNVERGLWISSMVVTNYTMEGVFDKLELKRVSLLKTYVNNFNIDKESW